jgi:hypothetical protein
MSKKWSRKIAATSAIIAVAVIVGAAVPVSSQQPPERTTLTFFDPRNTNFEKFINQGPKSFGPGDAVLFIEKLKDPESCERAGKIIGRFTVSKTLGRENAFFLADFGFRLADGTITGYHAGKFSDFESETRNHLAVTGGTQAYRDATGEFTIGARQELCGSKGDLITVDLLLQ